ncbi:hypothetical protein IFM46972_08705, partial [Aspergillus udagawae]
NYNISNFEDRNQVPSPISICSQSQSLAINVRYAPDNPHSLYYTNQSEELTDLHCLRIIETLHGSEDSLDPQEKAFVIKISRLVEGEGWFGSERDIIVVSFMRFMRDLAVGEEALEETWCRRGKGEEGASSRRGYGPFMTVWKLQSGRQAMVTTSMMTM